MALWNLFVFDYLCVCVCVCVCVSVLIFSGLLRLSAVQTVVLNDFPPDLYLVASAGQMPGHIHAVTSTLPYLEKNKQAALRLTSINTHAAQMSLMKIVQGHQIRSLKETH